MHCLYVCGCTYVSMCIYDLVCKWYYYKWEGDFQIWVWKESGRSEFSSWDVWCKQMHRCTGEVELKKGEQVKNSCSISKSN